MYYMFTRYLVFSLIHSFSRLTRILIPLTASQPIGIFRTLGKRVETIFMGLSGRRSLFSSVSPSRAPFFLVPTTSKRLLANYVFNFSWDGCNTQEKKKTRVMQNFGGQIRCIMGDVQVAYRRRLRTYMIGSKLKELAWLSNFELFESSNKGNCSNQKLQNCWVEKLTLTHYL